MWIVLFKMSKRGKPINSVGPFELYQEAIKYAEKSALDFEIVGLSKTRQGVAVTEEDTPTSLKS
jgi:hypothetical protein